MIVRIVRRRFPFAAALPARDALEAVPVADRVSVRRRQLAEQLTEVVEM